MFEDFISESIEVKQAILGDKKFLATMEQVMQLMKEALLGGKKILVAGNGGSAADAQHFAAEIVCRFKKERKGYPMIALTTDTSVMTAWGNDYEFATVFARQVEALGSQGDIFIGISTSGNSENIIQAATKAKSVGMKVVGLLGNGGGKIAALSDLALIVPSANTPRIQEAHVLLLHSLSEEVEKFFN